MNVIELFELSEWYKSHHERVSQLYNALHTALNHNATQPSQEPIEEQLQNLLLYLSGINIGELSIQQLQLIEDLQIGSLLGEEGAQYVESTVKTASYDPASTRDKIHDAIQKVNNAHKLLSAYSSALTNLGIESEAFADVEGRVVVRIGFKKDASINNVVDWKDTSKEWYDIIRGLALATGERPEDTKVIGATNGSIVFVLAATAAVTILLAQISKHITGIAKDVISVQIERENLRHKKMLSKAMETEFAKLEKKTHEDGIAAIKKEIAAVIPKGAQGDVTTALDSSISKLLGFGKKGGDVDFVSPPVHEVQDEEGVDQQPANGALAEIEKARRVIQEYQAEREVVKLLEDKRDKDSDG